MQNSMIGFISVQESLPLDGSIVFVQTKGGKDRISCYSKRKGFYGVMQENGRDEDIITHWRYQDEDVEASNAC